MRITESQLRRIIRQEVRRLNENAGPILRTDLSASKIINMIHNHGKRDPNNSNIRVLTLDKLAELIKNIERSNERLVQHKERYGPRAGGPPAPLPQFPSKENSDLRNELESEGVIFDEEFGTLTYDSTEDIRQDQERIMRQLDSDRRRGWTTD